MPEYLAPGVYVEEVDTGSKPIEGVSTTTSGMVGVTERGPVNVPTLVIGTADFRRQFGWYLDRRVFTGDTWYLPHAVKGFFDNGGKRLYIVRVLPNGTNGATYAETQLFDRGDTGVGFSTTLASRAEQDEGLILVADNTGIAPGNSLLISDGASSEYLQVAGNTLALGTPVVNAQAADTPVVGYGDDGIARQLSADAFQGDPNILLTDVTGLNAIGGDLLRIGTGAQMEFVLTDSADPTDNTVPVTLRSPLVSNHLAPPPTPVRHLPLVGSTPLVHQLSAGDRLTIVEDEAQIAGSQAIGFGGPPSTEFHPLGDVGPVAVLTQLALNHNSGASVVIPTLTVDVTVRALTADAQANDSQITLDERTGLAQGLILRLRTTPPDEDEYVIIDDIVPPAAAAPNPGVVTLRNPLRRSYTATPTQEVRLITDSGPDASETILARDANPGERGLILTDASAYTAGSIVRIEAAASGSVEYHQLVVSTIALVSLNQPLTAAHAAGSEVLGRSPVLLVQAIDRGAWGNFLQVIADDDTPILETTPTTFPGIFNPDLTLRSLVGVEAGTILEFYRIVSGTFTSVFLQKVESVLSGNRVRFGAGGLAQAVAPDMRVRTREFRLTTNLVRINQRTQKEEIVPGMTETLRQLSLDPRHSRYVGRVAGPIPGPAIPLRADGRTDGESDFIRVQDSLTLPQAQATMRVGPDILRETLPDGRVRLVGRRLTGGDDQIASLTAATADAMYIGADAVNPQDRTGLYALKNIEEISIVAIPGRTSQRIQDELITHCELMRYRFAVLDSRVGNGVAEVQEHRGLYDSKYAAIYYPWLRITDPFPDNPRAPGEVSIPPSGHVMGIYARSDIERGVHKAPANEVIRGIQDLEFKLMKEEQDILNPRNINVLRNFRENNRGLRVWGARNISSDPAWKYVNVRRLFIFVEHSIDRGTQWVVFEPNNEFLWERVRRVISAFLTNVWRDGALMGKTREEAYFVKCDRATMTQNDIDNGRLIVLVGIAPVKPAEFVIFRIGQWAGGSELEEG